MIVALKIWLVINLAAAALFLELAARQITRERDGHPEAFPQPSTSEEPPGARS